MKIIENSARFEQNLKNIILSEQKIVKVFEQFFYFSALTKIHAGAIIMHMISVRPR